MYKFYFIFNIKCVRGYLTDVLNVCNTGHLMLVIRATWPMKMLDFMLLFYNIISLK